MDELSRFYAWGLSHQKLNTRQRDFFIKNTSLKEILQVLFHEKKIDSYVLVQTCLRIEIYFTGPPEGLDTLTKKIGLFQDAMYLYRGLEAFGYLNRVICGLDSVIICENQILSQIRKAYFLSLDQKTTNPLLNKIFNLAIHCGKKFRHESKIHQIPVTLERITVSYLENFFPDLKDRHIFVVGTSELNHSIIYLLKKHGYNRITLTNRSSHKTVQYKNRYQLETVDFTEKNRTAGLSDIIVSATTAPHLIFHKEQLEPFISDGRKRLFLDLAVPMDIEESIGSIPGVTLRNLDDLWDEYRKNMERREEDSKDFLFIMDSMSEELERWLNKRVHPGVVHAES